MGTTTPDAAAATALADRDAEMLFYSIMSNPMNDDPYAGYRELRTKAPALITSDGTIVLTRYVDCDAALRHRALGKTDDMRGYLLTDIPSEQFDDAMRLLRRSMSFANPPEHTRLRQPVSSAFTNRHVEGLRATITAQVDALLDRMADEPGADFISTVAKPLPVGIMADLLGIPEQDRGTITPKFQAFTALAEPIIDIEKFNLATAAQAELADYFAGQLAYKRTHPGNDLLTSLACIPAEEALDEPEMVATVLLLFGAGIETTTNLLGNGLYALLTHPEAWTGLRADRSLVPSTVEEFLRFDSPVQLDARTVLEPITFAGVPLEPGTTVTTVLGAANRDPERFTDPDRFDAGRADNAHLSFAAGAHFCLGAHLTQLEAQVFLDRLAKRFATIDLDEAPQRRAGLGLRGFAHLPVTVRPCTHSTPV